MKFLGGWLVFLGQYSPRISVIARAFPSTLHQRATYLQDKLVLPSVHRYVSCRKCLKLHDYADCLEKHGSRVIVKACECQPHSQCVPLLKEVITSDDNRKYYPFMIYPYTTLVSSLKSLFSRPGFYTECELWRKDYSEDNQKISDVYHGRLWKDFLQYQGTPFLSTKNSIVFMLNVDWFQPFKHRVYSVGAMYLSILNLPRAVQNKRENIILLGVFPGPFEPSKDINEYLNPFVSELLSLWDGVSFVTHDSGPQKIRCALLYVCCDLPAGRKVCGFLSYSANLGCSKCFCNFGAGVFGTQNNPGFNRDTWNFRSNEKHREDVRATLNTSSKSARAKKESELGCRNTSLLKLPYFNPIRMLAIDPMHNLYLGTAKRVFNKIWLKRGIVDSESLKKINERIRSLNVPPEVKFGRLPACMEHSSQLTAEQWMLWVNYYSMYCLHGILPTEDLECWRHFVLASRTFCKCELSRDDITVADALLLRFCRRFEILYGGEAVTPNIHLHAHLADCILEYGPISTFWLFSFERFNGLLGDEPTNNRSIELQLMTRFLKDNAHLQLLSSLPSSSINISFSDVVLEQALSFTSTKHLDTYGIKSSKNEDKGFVPAKKYTIHCFATHEVALYRKLHPSIFDQVKDVYVAQTCRKMLSVTMNGQIMNAGQYFYTRSVFQFPECSILQATFL